MPPIGAIAQHLRARMATGVSVLASGEVNGVEKVYATAHIMPNASHVGAPEADAIVLAEFVLQRTSSCVYMVFKVQPCERVDVLPGCIEGLRIGDVITPVQGTARSTFAERAALGLATY